MKTEKSVGPEPFPEMIAAYMYAREGAPQAVIAQVLGVTQSSVSRLLAKAVDNRILVPGKPSLNTEIVTDEIERSIVDRILPREFQAIIEELKAISPSLQDVRVVITGSDSSGSRAFEERRRVFGQRCAPEIRDYCEKSQVVAVAWGGTVSAIVSAIAAQTSSQPKKKKISFIPMLGDPLGFDDNVGNSSSRLAKDLELAIGRGDSNSLSLAGIAALIPEKFSAQEVNTIKRFLEEAVAYQKVFGKHNNDITSEDLLANKVDCVITGFSIDGRAWWIDNDAFCRSAGIDRDKLQRVSLGDIGGVLIRRPNLSDADRKTYEDYLDRWTGFRLSHLERCSKKATNNKKIPGVIAVGLGGKRKGHVAYHLITEGLVNRLVADQVLLREIKSEMDVSKR